MGETVEVRQYLIIERETFLAVLLSVAAVVSFTNMVSGA